MPNEIIGQPHPDHVRIVEGVEIWLVSKDAFNRHLVDPYYEWRFMFGDREFSSLARGENKPQTNDDALAEMMTCAIRLGMSIERKIQGAK